MVVPRKVPFFLCGDSEPCVGFIYRFTYPLVVSLAVKRGLLTIKVLSFLGNSQFLCVGFGFDEKNAWPALHDASAGNVPVGSACRNY